MVCSAGGDGVVTACGKTAGCFCTIGDDILGCGRSNGCGCGGCGMVVIDDNGDDDDGGSGNIILLGDGVDVFNDTNSIREHII